MISDLLSWTSLNKVSKIEGEDQVIFISFSIWLRLCGISMISMRRTKSIISQFSMRLLVEFHSCHLLLEFVEIWGRSLSGPWHPDEISLQDRLPVSIYNTRCSTLHFQQNSGLGPIVISIYCSDVLSRWIHSACGLEPINICPTISESILSVMCQEFPTVRFRQALNHLKHIGDCFIYWSRSVDVWVEPMK